MNPTPEQAREAVLAGRTVRMTVGTDADDPVILVRLEDGCPTSISIAGWSSGAVEPICAPESTFLLRFLSNRHRLEIL